MPIFDATLSRLRSLSRGGVDWVRAKVKQDPLRAAIVAVLLALYLILIVGHVYWRGAGWWMNPSLRVTLQTDQTGYAQVFFDHGDGKTTEANSIFVGTPRQLVHNLVFPAKRNAPIAAIRFDPSNVFGANVKVWDVRLCGPLGIGERRIPVTALDKPSGLSVTAAEEGVLTLVTQRADSWIMLRGKKVDLTLPWFGYILAPLVVTLVSSAAAIWIFRIVIPWEGSWLTFGAHALALIYFTYLVAFFALPVRQMRAPWFFPTAWIALGGVGALLIASRKEGGWIPWLRRQPTLLILIGFILYFGSRILLMEQENHAPKEEVLHTLIFWGISGLVFAAAMPHLKFSRERLYLLTRAWWVVVAVSAIANMAYYYGFPSGPRFPADRLIYAYNPVFPAIVGSACYALALLVCAATTPAPRDLRSAARFLLHLAGIVIISVYIAQCMSRTVVYSLLLALLGAVGAVLIKRRPAGLVGYACALALTVGLSFGPLPAWIAKHAAPVPLVPAAALANVPDKADWTEFEEQNLGGRNRMLVTQDRRSAIWAAYWKASQKHLVFGHGFSGTQGVVVEKFAEMGIFHNGIPKPTSAHSLYMSALYYGGFIGLLLTAGLPLSVFGCGVWHYLRTADPWQLVPALLAVVGGLLLAGECAIIAQLKDSVLCWRPNGYWVAAWGVFLAGIIQQSLMSSTTSTSPSPAHGD